MVSGLGQVAVARQRSRRLSCPWMLTREEPWAWIATRFRRISVLAESALGRRRIVASSGIRTRFRFYWARGGHETAVLDATTS